LLGLEVTGGSQGIRLANSSFITIESFHIHDTDDVTLVEGVLPWCLLLTPPNSFA
jgi:hypothetical protein